MVLNGHKLKPEYIQKLEKTKKSTGKHFNNRKEPLHYLPQMPPLKTVMCFGTFDLLHLGHLYYFEQAKKYGDYLIVVIARDKTKQQQKKKIIFSEQERLKMVQSLRIVNEAVLGNVDDHLKIIVEKKPEVICLGYDQKINEKELKVRLAQRKLYPRVVRISSYHPHSQKSTKIRKLFGL